MNNNNNNKKKKTTNNKLEQNIRINNPIFQNMFKAIKKNIVFMKYIIFYA